MKNKIISAILCGAIIVGATVSATSCSGKNDKKGENGEISVMLLEKGLGKDFLNDVADDFYDNTGILVNIDSDPSLDEKVKQDMDADDAQDDIYMVGATYDWVKWAANGTIEDLTDLCDEEYSDGSTINTKIASSIRNLGKIGDHRFIVQFSYCPTGIVYNQDMLDDLYKKNIVDSNVFPTTWTGFVKLLKDVSSSNYKYDGNKVYGMAWGNGEFDLSDTFKTLWAQSNYDKYVEYFEQTEIDESLFVSDERIKALEALYDAIDPVNGQSSTSVPQLLAAEHKEGYRAFLRGESLVCFAGTWFRSEMDANIDEDTFNFRFAPIPAMDGNEIVTNINYPTEYFFIPSNSANKDKAKQFLKFMFEESNLRKIHSAIQTPLAFEYDMTGLDKSQWSKDVTASLSYKNVVSGSTSLYYLVGALRPEITTGYDKMYKGTVARDKLKTILDSDYETKRSGWSDKVPLVERYEQIFRQKGYVR